MERRAARRHAPRPLLLLLFAALACAPQLARAQPSKVSRGVAVPFVFDPHAVCSPPCQHGGLCIRNATCFCAKGYEGELCQHATCYPKCKNGGKCLRPGKCRCQPSYGGRYCHKVSCEGGCQNGGECISVNGMVKCICASGWTDSRCQEECCYPKESYTPLNPLTSMDLEGYNFAWDCNVVLLGLKTRERLGLHLKQCACFGSICPQGCHNGGACVAPGICSCAAGWVGGACHLGLTLTTKNIKYNMIMTKVEKNIPLPYPSMNIHALCRLPCHHGGKCIAPDVCRCRSPYSGLQCTKRMKE